MIVDELEVGSDGRSYAEGWQSWSPTTWYKRADEPHRPAEGWQHVMRFRPGVEVPASGVQGEGLLVVDPGEGSTVRGYGVADAHSRVPSIRAEWLDDRVLVHADGEVESWDAASGDEALAVYGARLGEAMGARIAGTAPRVWCTWYHYFEAVSAADVLENLMAIERERLAVDVVQIDDGWSLGTGEWMRPRPGFGSLPDTVAAILDSGHRAGLWLAPFLVGAGSTVAREHPEWLVGPAGINWGGDLVGLDLTHPGVRGFLTELLDGLRALGIDYLKLDFLYAGALPGPRFDVEATPIEAYRSGLQLVREVMGEEADLLGCGAPILPSIGLVDAMRVSPDTFHEGGEDGSQGLRGRLSVEARAWQDGRFYTTDPDCLVARPQFALRDEWADVVLAAPGIRGFSDRIADLDDHGLDLVRRLLERSGR